MYHCASSALLPGSLSFASQLGSAAEIATSTGVAFTYVQSKMRRILAGHCSGTATAEEKISNGRLLSSLPVRVYKSDASTLVSEAIFLTVERIGATAGTVDMSATVGWVENTP